MRPNEASEELDSVHLLPMSCVEVIVTSQDIERIRTTLAQTRLPSVIVHVSVCMQDTCTTPIALVREQVMRVLLGQPRVLLDETWLAWRRDPTLASWLQHVYLNGPQCGLQSSKGATSVETRETQFEIHVFHLRHDTTNPQQEEQNESVRFFSAWPLPHRAWHGLWQSLIYEDDTKKRLLAYMETAMLFALKGVHSCAISWNRMALLHGQPGTGKSSLARGLAQELAIRFSDQGITNATLVDVNAHALFSKYFAESAQHVTQLFDNFIQMLDQPRSLLIVLLDEVESLSTARQRSAAGHEPGDAVRVVNALLTQIDRLSQHPNVVIIATTNLTQLLDDAFVDRADLKLFIPLPPTRARYCALLEGCKELMRVGLISPHVSLMNADSASLQEPKSASFQLWQCAQLSDQMSGRTLRKLPFLTWVQLTSTLSLQQVSLSHFLQTMLHCIQREKSDRS